MIIWTNAIYIRLARLDVLYIYIYIMSKMANHKYETERGPECSCRINVTHKGVN